MASGINYFSIGIIGKKNIVAAFSSSKWQEFYLESQCFCFDPVVQCASINVGIPIDWHSIPLNTKQNSFIMETRKELTGCSEGFSLVQKIDDDSSAILAFGTCASFAGLVENYSRYKDEISILTKTFIQ